MSGFVLPPPPVVSVPVAGMQARFPVRRIFCVGRNYADHAREMGHDPTREPPFFFMKPASTLLTDDADLAWPPATGDLHFEGELVAALGSSGAGIAPDRAAAMVWGLAAGNDLTRRDLQAQAKRLGRPWDMAKGFDGSAACGAITPVADLRGSLTDLMSLRGRITTQVNGQIRQQGCLSQMIWSLPQIIAHLSGLVRLMPGDLVMTGTPAGVGALSVGDLAAVTIEGLAPLRTRVTAPAA